MRFRGPRAAHAVAAALLAAAAGAARADGITLFLEPSYFWNLNQTTDQGGNASGQQTSQLVQNYRLQFDRSLTPAFYVGAGAFFEGRRSWTSAETTAGVADASVTGVYARFTFNLPSLTAGITWDWADEIRSQVPNLVYDNLTAYATWRPLDLPELSLRLNRAQEHDLGRLRIDLVTLSVLGTARYLLNPFEVRYTLQWSRPDDAISGTLSSLLSQTVQATYTERILGGRSAVYVSLILRNQMVETLAPGTGTLLTQQSPIAGLSLVEVFPILPTEDTLAPNPALVDGNTTVSAGLDVGYAPTLAGDTNLRDMGVQFADVLTPVNLIRVWVNKPVPPELAPAWTWTAYQSADNRTWTPVAITAPVIFGPYQDRFEIPIRPTQARYLKVVTRPLAGGVTVDPAYANVLVTEVQAFLVQPAAAVPARQATSGARLYGSASTQIWRAAGLEWDVTAQFERRISPTTSTWYVTNVLNGSQWLGRTLQLNERVSRQDGDDGIGRYGQTDWSIGLVWRPVVAVSGTLGYSGNFVEARPVLNAQTGLYESLPVGISHSVTALARADLYEGVSVLANVSGALESRYGGTNNWSGAMNLSANLVPNRWLGLTFAWNQGLSWLQVPGQPIEPSHAGRIDGSLTFRPTTAISAQATVSRVVSGLTPTTFGTLTLNYAPFQGDLQLYVNYSRTFDTFARSVMEILTPGFRWNLRPGIQLNASYGFFNSQSPVQQILNRSLNAGLSLLL